MVSSEYFSLSIEFRCVLAVLAASAPSCSWSLLSALVVLLSALHVDDDDDDDGTGDDEELLLLLLLLLTKSYGAAEDPSADICVGDGSDCSR